MTVDGERRARLAGERAVADADRALEGDDGDAARAGYLAAADHFRRAAACAAAAGDDGARRADEAAAADALRAALPIVE
jgi:hypothetical protein